MAATKALIFGIDELFWRLKPYYDMEVVKGNLEIIGYAIIGKDGNVKMYSDLKGGKLEKTLDFNIALISSRNNFYKRRQWLEGRKISRKKIVDGRIFQIPNLNVPRFLKEGVVYGVFEDYKSFTDTTSAIYPRVYGFKENPSIINLGAKSRINENNRLEGEGEVNFGKFSAISWDGIFELGINYTHNPRNVTHYGLIGLDWPYTPDFLPPQGTCKINVGNDVWMGRGVRLKSANPEKPLTIGDGAIVAADSVVVKDVEPYTVVGGNPARFIKYRFPENIIEALLKIKWWDWSLDKIYENFKYFNDVEKFVEMYSK